MILLTYISKEEQKVVIDALSMAIESWEDSEELLEKDQKLLDKYISLAKKFLKRLEK